MWPLVLKGLSKVIKQNLHICQESERSRGSAFCFILPSYHSVVVKLRTFKLLPYSKRVRVMASGYKSDENEGSWLEHKNVKQSIWAPLWMR